MLKSGCHLSRAGLDAVALKPTECDVERVLDSHVETVTIDYEGHEHLPSREVLERLADEMTVRLTAPVRADGFDPLGDDGRYEWVPDDVGMVLVAGHPAYLTNEERGRAIAPRLGAARERYPDAWVGTEGVERVALAAGGTQFELLGRNTEKSVRALRAAGFEDDIAVYAPTVLSGEEDDILDAVGEYVARRGAVRRALPDGGETDSKADGRTRDVLSRAARDFALVGDAETVHERVARLRDAGVTHVVGYPAQGLDAVLE